MIRKIIKIDEEKCTGCALCVEACHEGAIKMVNGKAKLIRDDYCDGLGDCLPACPVDAISFEMREAAEYNEAAVLENKFNKPLPCGCPGILSKTIKREDGKEKVKKTNQNLSRLSQWPVQIKLAPLSAPYFKDADLLIAADCTAYAYGNFHDQFIKNRVTLIGCPKLDEGDYSEKLALIIRNNNIKSILVVRMEVPCCKGIQAAVQKALKASGKDMECKVITISTDGKIIDSQEVSYV